MALIDALSRCQHNASLKELSLSTHLHRSTACRILEALHRHGYVDRVATGFYRLGTKARTVKNATTDIEVQAHNTLERVRDAVGETVSIARFNESHAIFTSCMSGGRVPLIDLAEGTAVPLHAAACGKLWLGECGVHAVNVYAARFGLAALTSATVTDVEKLLHETRRAHKRGYGREFDEVEQGYASIATLISDCNGPIAALSIHAPRARLDMRWITLLQAHAVLLTQQLCQKHAA